MKIKSTQITIIRGNLIECQRQFYELVILPACYVTDTDEHLSNEMLDEPISPAELESLVTVKPDNWVGDFTDQIITVCYTVSSSESPDVKIGITAIFVRNSRDSSITFTAESVSSRARL